MLSVFLEVLVRVSGRIFGVLKLDHIWIFALNWRGKIIADNRFFHCGQSLAVRSTIQISVQASKSEGLLTTQKLLAVYLLRSLQLSKNNISDDTMRGE